MIFSTTNATPAGNIFSTTLDAPFKIDSLQFTSSPLGILSVGIAPGTGGTLELLPVSPISGIKVFANSGTIAISSPLTVSAAQTWDIDAAGALNISGNVAFNAAVSKTNGGPVTLSGANTGSGAIKLLGGTLAVANASALGNGTFTVSGGASLDNTNAALTNLSTNNVQFWNGDFTFIATNSLNMGTGAVTLGVSPTVTVGTANNTLTVGGTVSGNGLGLSVAGPGQLTLAGSSANTFTGPVTIFGGGSGPGSALVLAKTSGNAIAGTLVTIGNNAPAAGTDAALRLGGSEQINNNAIIHFNNGASNARFDLNNSTETIAGLTIDGGTGAIVENLDAGTGGAATLIVKNDVVDSVYGGIMRDRNTGTGTLALTKIGLSKMSLAGTGIGYSGVTNLQGGTFELNGATAFASSVAFAAGSTATLQVAGATQPIGGLATADILNPNDLVQNASGVNAALIVNQSGTATFGGILQNNPLGGSFRFVKSGPGTLTLNTAGAYTGGTVVDNGTLIMAVDQNLQALVFGNTLGGTNVGTLDLTNANGIFHIADRTDEQRRIEFDFTGQRKIAHAINGPVTILSSNAAPDLNTFVAVSGGPYINNLGANAILIGFRNAGATTQTGNGSFATLDLSNATSAQILGTAGSSIGVATETTTANGVAPADAIQGTLKLSVAGPNTLNAGTITMGKFDRHRPRGNSGLYRSGKQFEYFPGRHDLLRPSKVTGGSSTIRSGRQDFLRWHRRHVHAGRTDRLEDRTQHRLQ